MKYILSGELTQDKLREIIQSWYINEQPKLQKYYDYYIGQQAITRKTYKDPSKPCNRIVTNFCHQIVQQYLGFNIGVPVTYEVSEQVQDILNYNDVTDKDNLLLRNALIFGKAFEIQYIDTDKKTRFDIIDTRFGIDVYGDELEKDELKYFIRMYCTDTTTLTDTNNWRVEVYDNRNIYIYSANYTFTNLTLLDTQVHNFGQVPVTVFMLNEEAQSIFAQVMSLQDAYNTLISSEIDDWEAFVDCFLVLSGVTADEQDIQDMKENRVLILDQDSSAEYLTKQVNDSQIQNMLKDIKDRIFNISNCPDFSDKDFMAQSGIALQYKLVGFNNISKAIMNRMEKAIRKRIELFQTIEGLKGVGEDAFTDVGITFTQNIPANTLDTAQIVNQLRGIVSTKTLLGLLPFIKDVDEELQEIDKENEKNRELYGFDMSTTEEGDTDNEQE